MGFIVFNKRTGGYLKNHACCYREFCNRIRWKLLRKSGGIPAHVPDEAVEREAFSADAVDARVYARKCGVADSVGKWDGNTFHKPVIPKHLEIREVKTVTVRTITVIRPGEERK